MRIGAVALAAGVSCDTLRFYEKLGLIRSTRTDNRYRRYAPPTAQLVGYIRAAQRLGFTLAEIGASMPAIQAAPDPDAALAVLLAAKAQIIDARIVELQALRDELATRARQHCPMQEVHCTNEGQVCHPDTSSSINTYCVDDNS